MKKIMLNFLFGILSVFTIYAQETVQGNVKNAVTLESILDVTVIVEGTSLTINTNSLGEFIFSNSVPLGDQILKFSKEGYVENSHPITVIEGQTVTITDLLLELHWEIIDAGTTELLRDVHFVNETLGRAVGTNTILKTEDGGASWQANGGLPDTRYYGVYFKDELTGYAVGKKATSSTAGRIHYTTDGGVTWQVYLTGTVNLPWWSVAFTDDGLHGAIVGQEGRALYTSDGGVNWYPRTLPSGDAGTIKDVTFYDGLNGIAVGYDAGSGVIMKTTDGGSSWTDVVTNLVGQLNSVSFGNTKIGIAVGSSGKIYRTIDGGDSWVEAPSGTTNTLNAVNFDEDTNLYVVGNGGTILFSDNNGVSWKLEGSPTTYTLYGVFNNTDKSSVAVGPLGTVIRNSCIPSVEPSISFDDNDSDPDNQNTTMPFIAPKVITKATNYFYFYVEENCDLPPKNLELVHNFSAGGNNISLIIKYIGAGILQCSLDLATPNFSAGETLNISFPESITQEDIKYNFLNKPQPFSVTLFDNSKSQSIDLFAGASIGGDIIVGGAGVAGASIAAAKISASGSAGMGLTFERDESGNQKISRRFEAGVAGSINIPSIDLGIDKLEVTSGFKAGFNVKGSLGQTMSFPATLNEDLTKKAKAAYLLETFAIGGVNLNPYAGIFLGALQKSLVATNTDLNVIYSDLLESNQRGETFEGNASVGFSYKFDDFELTLSELAQNVALSRMKVNNVKNQTETIKFGYARGYNAAILDFKVHDTDVASAFDFSAGSDISIAAELQGSDVKNFVLSFATTEKNTQIDILSYSKGHNYDFEVPEQVILDNYGKENVLGSISSMLGQGQRSPFSVGVNSFTGTLNAMYQVGKDKLVNYPEHTLMNTRAVSSIGVKSDTSIDLKAILGVGFGISLGMEYSYIDDLEYLEKTHIVAEGKVLPMVEKSVFSDDDRFFSLPNEVNDLFTGVALLIQGTLNELVKKYEALKDAANNVLMSIADGAVKLYGEASQGYKWVLRTVDPAYDTALKKGTYFKSEIKRAYVSKSVSGNTSKNASGKFSSIVSSSTLYIISDNINVNLLDIDDNPIETFDPVTLSITIDQIKVDELEFTDTEKALAKMYLYDEVNFVWEEVVGDDDADINIVATQITNAGNYAIGIAYDTASDTSAPDILDHYPKNGNIIPPSDEHWATLYEPITGAGIDLSQTIIKIDGVEVDSYWDPVNDKIGFTPLTPLADGVHTFEVIVQDLNGNPNSVFSTFTVDSALSTEDVSGINSLKMYPNPTKGELYIKGDVSQLRTVDIYSLTGQHVMSVNQNFEKINIENLKPAVYFVQIKTDNAIRVYKIIKE